MSYTIDPNTESLYYDPRTSSLWIIPKSSTQRLPKYLKDIHWIRDDPSAQEGEECYYIDLLSTDLHVLIGRQDEFSNSKGDRFGEIEIFDWTTKTGPRKETDPSPKYRITNIWADSPKEALSTARVILTKHLEDQQEQNRNHAK